MEQADLRQSHETGAAFVGSNGFAVLNGAHKRSHLVLVQLSDEKTFYAFKISHWRSPGVTAALASRIDQCI
jgi:hypothetical protein